MGRHEQSADFRGIKGTREEHRQASNHYRSGRGRPDSPSEIPTAPPRHPTGRAAFTTRRHHHRGTDRPRPTQCLHGGCDRWTEHRAAPVPWDRRLRLRPGCAPNGGIPFRRAVQSPVRPAQPRSQGDRRTLPAVPGGSATRCGELRPAGSDGLAEQRGRTRWHWEDERHHPPSVLLPRRRRPASIRALRDPPRRLGLGCPHRPPAHRLLPRNLLRPERRRRLREHLREHAAHPAGPGPHPARGRRRPGGRSRGWWRAGTDRHARQRWYRTSEHHGSATGLYGTRRATHNQLICLLLRRQKRSKAWRRSTFMCFNIASLSCKDRIRWRTAPGGNQHSTFKLSSQLKCLLIGYCPR